MLLNKLPDYIEPYVPKLFDFQLPNPGEWATNAATKFVDASMDQFMQIFISSFQKVLILIEQSSFEVCLIVGLIALILYIFGWDKAKKIATLSPAIYIILQIFFSVWFGI